MLHLIINADDYGLSKGVNEAVLELTECGVLSSTTVMVNMPHHTDIVQLLPYTNISIGLHFNLTEGRPISNPAKISTLVDHEGFFLSQKRFRKRVVTGRVKSRHIGIELAAQVKELENVIGTRLTHIDTHQNIHKSRTVAQMLINYAKKHKKHLGLRSPARYLLIANEVESRVVPSLPRSLRKGKLRQALAEIHHHLLANELGQFFFMPTGELHSPSLKKLDLLKALAKYKTSQCDEKRTFEVACHPATHLDGITQSHLAEKRIAEYQLLRNPAYRKALRQISLLPYPPQGTRITL